MTRRPTWLLPLLLACAAGCTISPERASCATDLDCERGEICWADERCIATYVLERSGWAPDAGPTDARLVDAVTTASTDAGCVEESVPPSDIGPQIRLQSLSVDRPSLELSSGEIVTWTNADSMEHTATAGAPGDELPAALGGFGSPLLGTGARWAFRFCAPRELLWFCRTHPAQMRDYRLVIR